MANKEGSMGLAVFIAFIAFIFLNGILGMFTPICTDMYGTGSFCMSAMDVQEMMDMAAQDFKGYGMQPGLAAGIGTNLLLMGFLAGATMIGLGGALFGSMSLAGIIFALIPATVAGLLAGIIARGSAGRGFTAGLSSTLIGYYIGFVIFIVTIAALGGLSAMGGLNMGMIVSLFILILIIPLIIGVIAGIIGALMSAILASPATLQAAQNAQPTISTTVINQGQQPAETSSQKAPTAPAQQPTATKVNCPACKVENDPSNLFCQSCGTRLKS